MKNKKSAKYRFLIHCYYPQIRAGFEENIRSLPFDYEIFYVNLKESGILTKLRQNPHLIIMLLNEGDAEIFLPLKIKLFAPDTPLLLILPSIPESYKAYLKSVRVDEIIELPAKKEYINKIIISLLNLS